MPPGYCQSPAVAIFWNENRPNPHEAPGTANASLLPQNTPGRKAPVGDDALNWPNLLGISIGLAMDAFAVSVAAGLALAPVTPRQMFRLAWHFGLFQFMMPILGWLAGQQLAAHIRAYDHWVAFALLAFVGGKMLIESRQEKAPGSKGDPTRGLMLVTLSVATSIDALAVGVSMAFLGVSVWFPSVVIGIVAATLTAIGFGFGSRLGTRWSRRAEAAGGCVLLLIGSRILITDLLG